MSSKPEPAVQHAMSIDWSRIKAFVEYADAKSQRTPSRPMQPCQCGKMLRFGREGEWNCGPACVKPSAEELEERAFYDDPSGS